MTVLRFALIVTFLLASMYAAVSLLDSLYWFGWWGFVAGMSFIGQHFIGWVESRRLAEYRRAVWERRDAEAEL